MATTRNLRRGSWILWVVLLLVPSARVDAWVSVYPSNAGDAVDSVLTTRIISEDGEPIGSAWQTIAGQSASGTTLNGDGHSNGDGEPSVLLHPETGLAMAAWARSGSNGFDIVFSRFADGVWTAPEILVGSMDDELDPFLLVDPADGSVHLLYWVHDAGPRVMHMQAPEDLSGWSSAQQVSGFGEIAVRPAAVFHQGSLQVVYERHDLGYGSTPRQLVLATKTGSTTTRQTVGSTAEAAPNWPEVHARAGVLWVDWLHGPSTFAWTTQDVAGWEVLQFEGFTDAEDLTFRVRDRIKIQVLD